VLDLALLTHAILSASVVNADEAHQIVQKGQFRHSLDEINDY
jgi:hypothetical protein